MEMPAIGQGIGAASEEIIATGVTFEEYLERYSGEHCEWIGGTVIRMSPATKRHNLLIDFLTILFQFYFEQRPIGVIISSPFTMKMPAIDQAREPDLLIILKSNPHELTDTYIGGPADICIEVISPESMARDSADKFTEYEKAGVPEYWLLDPLHQDARFFRLSENGVYLPQKTDAQDDYRTVALPGFALHVPTLWQDPLPGPTAIGQMVQMMIKAEGKEQSNS